MTGLKVAFMIILSCFTVEASSSLLNHVASNDKLQILGVVGSHIHDTVAKIANLRSNLIKKRGIRVLVHPEKVKCHNIKSVILSLQNFIKDTQIMQLKEHAIAVPIPRGNIADATRSLAFVNQFRYVEYSLRDTDCKIRQLAKHFKVGDVPKYTVGLSRQAASLISNSKTTSTAANYEAFKKLATIKKCLKSFQRASIASKHKVHSVKNNMISSNKYSEGNRIGENFLFTLL